MLCYRKRALSRRVCPVKWAFKITTQVDVIYIFKQKRFKGCRAFVKFAEKGSQRGFRFKVNNNWGFLSEAKNRCADGKQTAVAAPFEQNSGEGETEAAAVARFGCKIFWCSSWKVYLKCSKFWPSSREKFSQQLPPHKIGFFLGNCHNSRLKYDSNRRF